MPEEGNPADVNDDKRVNVQDLVAVAGAFGGGESRAAYWDGRNAVGEPVASGVYFFTLTAGDFSATRKFLIRK